MSIKFTDPEILDDADLAQYMTELLQWSFFARWDAIQTNKRLLRMYMAKNEPRRNIRVSSGQLQDDIANMSNTYMPVATGIVDTAKSIIYSNLFATPDYIRCVSQEEEDEERSIYACRHLKTRHEQMGFLTDTIQDHIFEGLLYDFSVMITDWKVQGMYQTQPVTEDQTIKFESGFELKRTRTRNRELFKRDAISRVDTRIIKNRQCMPDPSFTRGTSNNGIGEFFLFTQDVSQNFLFLNRRTPDQPFGVFEFDPAEIEPGKDHLFRHVDNRADRRELSRRFIPASMEDVHLVTALFPTFMAVMTGNRKIIRRKRMTGMPVTKWAFRELPDRFGGLGILHVLERPQLDLNAMINDRRDFMNYVLNPIVMLDQGAYNKANLSDGQLYPGKIMTFDADAGERASDMIHIAQPGNPAGQDHQAEMSMSINIMETVSNISANSQAQVQSGQRSATEIREVANALQSSLGISALNLERASINPTYDFQMTLERLHFDGVLSIRDIGTHDIYMQITPEMLVFRSNPKMQALGMSHIVQGAVDKAQLLQAATISLNPAFIEFINRQEVVTAIWKAFRPNDYFRMLAKGFPSDQVNIPPSVEHMMFSSGRFPKVSPNNDDSAHLREHRLFKDSAGYRVMPPFLKNEFDKHIKIHESAQQSKTQPNQDETPVTDITQLLTSDGIRETQVAG